MHLKLYEPSLVRWVDISRHPQALENKRVDLVELVCESPHVGLLTKVLAS